MYRPEGWNAYIALLDNAHIFVNPNRTDKDAEYMIRAVEAGADDMLKGLKKEGWKVTREDVIPSRGKCPEIHLPNTGMKGYLVFIPKEKDDKTN